ncbi:methionyl-tRNA formyltransferase [Gilvimarinus sp. F26214L]|uniref:methionyl-tRNA formyltransferase n=1 Tax=Gilvimarinus sp. DZF01 TaxID=3461371 RepID=UPI004045E08C
MRVVFAGTPDFAAEYLAALLDTEHEVVAVYTQPDRPAGRGKKLSPSPVKALALDHGVPVYQPATLRDAAAQRELGELSPDVMVVVAYGLILPQAVLDLPRYGCLNVHASLLPRWRGAAPIQRAIEAGDRETGITIMQMDAGLDTGAMLAVARCPIEENDTAGSLFQKLAALGRDPLLSVLRALPDGTLVPTAQDDSLATYAKKIDKTEAAVDWRDDAALIDRKVRAFNPFPAAHTQLGGQRVKIYGGHPVDRAAAAEKVEGVEPGTILRADACGIEVQCGDGAFCIEHLQLPGKRSMSAKDVLLGNRDLLAPDERFGR